ncbi:MAG: GIY-YIG nuclease family protein [Cyanobacteria bacterium J06576_12]
MNCSSWFLYLVRTRHNFLYTGIAVDVSKRFAEHQQGKKGAKYLRILLANHFSSY